jgi:DNA transformation protein
VTQAEGSETLAHAVAEEIGVECRRWFGGWSLRRGGEQIAIVMDTLYLRVDDALRTHLDSTGASRPFRYHHRDGREIEVNAYWAVPPQCLDDPAALHALIDRVPIAPRQRAARRPR